MVILKDSKMKQHPFGLFCWLPEQKKQKTFWIVVRYFQYSLEEGW